MALRATLLWRKLARLEKAFLAVLLLDIILTFAAPASGWRLLTSIAAWLLGIVAAVRLIRRYAAQIIWRLRNRLIVAYVFIAVVPVLLIVVLVASATYVVTGQVAVYLVHSELERRVALLIGVAEHPELTERLMPFLNTRFPGVETDTPPAGWKKSTSGLILQDGQLYSWAHSAATLRAPITHDLLSTLVPGLGDVRFVSLYGQTEELDSVGPEFRDYAPPKYTLIDFPITGLSVVPVADWNAPGKTQDILLLVHTRPSAVLGIVFGQKFDFGQAAVLLFLGVAILFLMFEIGSR